MEPERPVEKLLRGFARQRREQTGDPPPMHPVVRRQLLSEVAKTYGQRQGISSVWLMLKGFWPRLALGAAGMAVLILGTAIWISPGSKNAEVQMAKNEGRRSPSSPIPLENKVLSDAPSAALDLNRIETNTALLVQGTVVDAVAAPPAVSAVASFEMKQAVQAGAAPSKAKDAAMPTLAANTPARELQEFAQDKASRYGRAAAVSGGAQPDPNSDSLKFGVALQANTRAEATGEIAKTEAAPAQDQLGLFQNTSVTQLFQNQMPTDRQAPPATVMAQFRVEQDGAVVRIIDNDGSIYTGSLQEAEQLTVAKAAPAAARAAAQRNRALSSSQPRLDEIQNFRLEVTGTNLTLNQKVVFTGNLVGNQISFSNTAQNQQSARQYQKVQQKQSSNVMRISGKARVGAGADQPVEAVPVQ